MHDWVVKNKVCCPIPDPIIIMMRFQRESWPWTDGVAHFCLIVSPICDWLNQAVAHRFFPPPLHRAQLSRRSHYRSECNPRSVHYYPPAAGARGAQLISAQWTHLACIQSIRKVHTSLAAFALNQSPARKLTFESLCNFYFQPPTLLLEWIKLFSILSTESRELLMCSWALLGTLWSGKKYIINFKMRCACIYWGSFCHCWNLYPFPATPLSRKLSFSCLRRWIANLHPLKSCMLRMAATRTSLEAKILQRAVRKKYCTFVFIIVFN